MGTHGPLLLAQHNQRHGASHGRRATPHPTSAPVPETPAPPPSPFQCTPTASLSLVAVHSFGNPSSDVELAGRLSDAYSDRFVLDTFEGRLECSYTTPNWQLGAVVRPQYGYTARRVRPADAPHVDVFNTAELTLQDAYAYARFGSEVGTTRLVEVALGAQPAPVGLFSAQPANNPHYSIPAIYQRQPFEVYALKLTLNILPELSFFLATALGWDTPRLPEGANGLTVLGGLTVSPTEGAQAGANFSVGPHNGGMRTLTDLWARAVLGGWFLIQGNLNFANAPASLGARESQAFGAQATMGVRHGIFRGAFTIEDYYDSQNIFNIVQGNNFSMLASVGVVVPFHIGSLTLDLGARVEGRLDTQGGRARVGDITGAYHDTPAAFACETGQCSELFTVGANVFLRTHVDFDRATGVGFF